MASKAVINSTLVFRIFTLLLLAASVVVMATNNFKLSDGTKTSFMDLIAFRYVAATALVGFVYTLVQIPFAVYHACIGERLIRNECLPEFDFCADMITSLLLGTGVGAGFAVSFELKKLVKDLIATVEVLTGEDLGESKSKSEKFLDRANIATGLLFLGFIFMAILSMLSSISRTAKTSKGFFG